MPDERLKYEEVTEWSREAVERAVLDDVPDALLRAVIAVSMYESDWRWAQDLCVRLSAHPHFNVRGNAVLGFGHIARVHGQLDKVLVHPIVESALRDPDKYIRGQAVCAADDTAFFLGWKYDGHDAG